MAVGDIVNGISGAATIFQFQPAAGVSIMVTTCSFYGSNVSPYFTDGVNVSGINWGTNGSNTPNNSKTFFDNTLYLYFQALIAPLRSAFSGIQIQ